jgi:hypothetical protein
MWNPIYLDADEFAEFEKHMKSPPTPTPAISKGDELLRKLYRFEVFKPKEDRHGK